MRRRVLIGLVAGVVVLTGAALFGPGAIKAAGAEPNLCATCHVMDTNVHSFQASVSAHKEELSCTDCHLPAGKEGLVEKYKTGLRHVSAQFSGEIPEHLALRAEDRNWVVDNCVRCHGTEEHIQQVGRSACLTCHATNPHGDKGATQ